MEPLDYNPASGDQVSITSGTFFMGQGTIVSFSKQGNAKMADVEMFDGTFYTVPLEELSRMYED